MCMKVSREASAWGRMGQGLLIWGHGCAAASTPLVERLFLLHWIGLAPLWGQVTTEVLSISEYYSFLLTSMSKISSQLNF